MTDSLSLIDTSVWILALRRNPRPAARDRIAAALVDQQAAICGVILQELLGGAVSEGEFARLEADLRGVTHVPIHESDWHAAAHLMFHLRRSGITVPTSDILIASVTLRSRAMLLHADAHFERIRAFTLSHPSYQPAPLVTESLLDVLQ